MIGQSEVTFYQDPDDVDLVLYVRLFDHLLNLLWWDAANDLVTSLILLIDNFKNLVFVDLNIFDRRSTISWCLSFSLFTSENESSMLLNLLDHILCLTKVSSTYFICCGIMSSTLSTVFLSMHLDLHTRSMLSSMLIIRYTYSIRISSPVIIIFYFSFLLSPSFLPSFEALCWCCSLIVASRGWSVLSPVVDSSTWELDLLSFEFLL